MKEILKQIDLQDCPLCKGPGVLEEEGGWCVYVVCPHCGTLTAFCRYDKGQSREEAVKQAVDLWNMGKVIAERRGE